MGWEAESNQIIGKDVFGHGHQPTRSRYSAAPLGEKQAGMGVRQSAAQLSSNAEDEDSLGLKWLSLAQDD
eukprot:scaffold3428_cov379-Prasinococcus_capsulatus_cf.AAC.4